MLILTDLSPVMAQDYDALLATLTKLSERAQQAQAAGRYRESLRCCEQQIRFFRELPDIVRRDLDAWNGGDWLAGQYYNRACYQSLAGQRRAAVASLEAAYEHGYFERKYSAYNWMLHDSDLDPVRSEKGYEALRLKAAEQGDFIGMLRSARSYDAAEPCDSLPAFRYAAPDDRNLVRLRRMFNLDSVAGAGDEISKIRNLCHWVHNTVRHDGGSYNPAERNAIAMIELCRREGKPCFLNKDANWNNEEPQTQEEYLELYMAKNLYYLVCPDRSEFDTETYREGKQPLRYVALVPPSYSSDIRYSTSNDAWFWHAPYGNPD
ncbi:MAG: hypothetical protein K2G58_07065 [Alistipes sp.]|nr:hypothetical protein [Alistipes sp.]